MQFVLIKKIYTWFMALICLNLFTRLQMSCTRTCLHSLHIDEKKNQQKRGKQIKKETEEKGEHGNGPSVQLSH